MIDISQFYFIFSAALLPSGLGAISGLGGGIIIKPVLDAVSSYTTEEINFLSGCTVLAMSYVTLLQHWMSNVKLDDKRGKTLAFGTVLGGTAGKFLFLAVVSGISASLIKTIQSSMLAALCLVVLLYLIRKKHITARNIQNRGFCLFLGLCLGMVSAFLGIGGGPINIMAISYCLGMDSKTTSRYSIYAIFLAQLASLTITLVSGRVPVHLLPALVVMVLGGICGGFFGARIQKRIHNRQVDIFIHCILVVVILLLIYNLVRSGLLQG